MLTLANCKHKSDKLLINDINDMYLFLKNLNEDKAHAWDNLSIRIEKLCGKTTALPLLSLIFKSMLDKGVFLD